MDGKGLFQWPDGRVYFGEFREGKKHGDGVFMWPNGQYYEGWFADDECSGEGTLFYPDGKKFEGVWMNGKKHGCGKYVWPNGASYAVKYIKGEKMSEGKLDGSKVPLDQLKNDYQNLAKKSYGAQRAMAQNASLREMRDDLSSGRAGQARGKQKKKTSNNNSEKSRDEIMQDLGMGRKSNATIGREAPY